jgi:hypothetical protein
LSAIALATERKVFASSHNPALSALLFLYPELLEEDLPWLTDINRPIHVRRIPSVLIKDEVACSGSGYTQRQAWEPFKLSNGFFKPGLRI